MSHMLGEAAKAAINITAGLAAAGGAMAWGYWGYRLWRQHRRALLGKADPPPEMWLLTPAIAFLLAVEGLEYAYYAAARVLRVEGVADLWAWYPGVLTLPVLLCLAVLGLMYPWWHVVDGETKAQRGTIYTGLALAVCWAVLTSGFYWWL